MEWKRVSLGILALGTLAGCGGPTRVAAPGWDPPVLVERAMELYDANRDGVIDEQELTNAPGLACAMWHLDSDGDKGLNQAELLQRLELFKRLKTGLISRSFRVTANGRPLVNANVRFVPEKFLEGVIEGASGVTDDIGVVMPQTEVEDIPAMRIGYYRVEVDSSALKSPRAAEATAGLGAEVSPVSDGIQSSGVSELQIKY